jgi:Lrp/AsnC family leucine-responsive transcriptional regulator
MDSKNEQILEVLKRNSKLSFREISRKTKIPLTTVHHRIKKMRREGVIKKYCIEVDYSKLGLNLCAYIMASVNYNVKHKISQQEIARKTLQLSFVESVDIITGGSDLLIKVRTKNVQQLNNLITKQLRNIEGIDKTTTMIVLEEIRDKQ